MKNTNVYNENRFKELSERAFKTNKFYFTDFLSLTEISLLKSLNIHNFTFFGGTDNCERVIARFGDENEIGYTEDFPVSCLKINLPKSGHGIQLTHRDYLGSLMSLGIERSTVGDIICNNNCAYIFVCDKIADYIVNELNTVGKCPVDCEKSEQPDNISLIDFKEKEINTASYRADCIISAVFNMSRTKSEAYFSAEQVFVNGKICNKSSILNIGDVVSVRHKGKFKIAEECGYSKKGRIFIKIYIYS